MNSLHIRRNFLKLVRRSGLISFSALGAGTALGLGTARSAQSQQTSKFLLKDKLPLKTLQVSTTDNSSKILVSFSVMPMTYPLCIGIIMAHCN
jgi:hypothetical protein